MGVSIGLIGWWKLDEGSGSIASDSSENGNDLSIINAPAWIDGKFGKSLQFNGSTNQYAQNPNINYLPNKSTSDFTMSCWVNMPTYKDLVHIIGFGAHPEANCSGLRCLFTCQYHYQYYDGSRVIDLGAPIIIGGWHHVALVVSDSTMSIYSDGILITQIARPTFIDGTNFMQIGGLSPWGNYINGSIDEVRIYNRALIQDDITELFNNVQPIIIPKLSTPVIQSVTSSFSSFLASWNPISNAIRYTINLYKNGLLIGVYNTTDTNYLFSLLYSNNYYISIVAIGDGINYNNSNSVNSDTISINGLFQGCPILNFMGFSTIVAPPAKLNFMGFSIEKAVKLSYLNFWGFSVVNAPLSILTYQIF